MTPSASRPYFATVARGLEPIAARELQGLGASDIAEDYMGVHFSGDRELLYRANLWMRTSFRILQPLREFGCNDVRELYDNVKAIAWEDVLSPDKTLAVRATGGNEALNHTHFTALKVKEGIVDRQWKQFGTRSSVDRDRPDVAVNLHVHRDRAVLSLDSSGDSLHRRGYRPAIGAAPLKETLAAALLSLADYDPSLPLIDPMCGSGTIALEAGMQARNIAPGLSREEFGFMGWEDFDADLWDRVCDEAIAQQRPAPAPIYASDIDPSVLGQAKYNAELCGLDSTIELAVRDVRDLEAPSDRGILICNPPYGERLGEVEELGYFYKRFGDVLKQRFKGWVAYILTTKPLSKRVGLRAAKRFAIDNGGLACTLLRYELY
ncbi:MAG: class I SAM-dependent RNA methyltransferase [Geitlerinemataceae cyanobacterium]